MSEMMKHPGWQVFLDDLREIRNLKVEHADSLFATNDEWQQWRGDKKRTDYVLNYPEFVRVQLELIETEDPSIVFADEVDSATNYLEDE